MGFIWIMDGSTHRTIPVGYFLFLSLSQQSTPYTLDHFAFIPPSDSPFVVGNCNSRLLSRVTSIEGWLIYSTNWDHIIEAAFLRNESA
jgi:hypothetical protein